MFDRCSLETPDLVPSADDVTHVAACFLPDRRQLSEAVASAAVGWLFQQGDTLPLALTGACLAVVAQLGDDGSPASVTVNAPQGDKVAGALNGRMAAAGVYSVMDLDVVKKLCQGSPRSAATGRANSA